MLGVLYLLLLVPMVTPFFAPNPYTDVNKQEVVWGEDGVTIRYDFVKNEGCHLVTHGSQSLNIRVPIDGQSPESIRLHTRHDCDGTMVNKVFTEADNPRDVK